MLFSWNSTLGRGNPLTSQRKDTLLPSFKQVSFRERLITEVGSERYKLWTLLYNYTDEFWGHTRNGEVSNMYMSGSCNIAEAG